jgi:hypothetical protein
MSFPQKQLPMKDNVNCYNMLQFTGHYILHIVAHFFAVNYLLVYILYKDAQENRAYMIDDVRQWSDDSLITTCVLFYSVVNIHAIYLSCIYSRHILPCVGCSIFYGLCYLALGLSNISGCQDREMLSCSDVVLSNRIIDISIDLICWAMLALTLWVCVYIISIVCYNFGRVYYYTANCAGEIVLLFASYYIGGVVVFGLPVCCMCLVCGGGADGDSGSVDYGNFVNGTRVDCSDSIV